MTPHLLDLFCGAGGASTGYARTGFDVTGVDEACQPRYPFPFIQAEALAFLDGGFAADFDAIHASPPCQRYTKNAKQKRSADTHPDLIAPTRRRLINQGVPYVIENVVGAPLRAPVELCGVMFGLGVFRHRWFELSWDHGLDQAHPSHTGRIGDGTYFTVTGHTGGSSTREEQDRPDQQTSPFPGDDQQPDTVRSHPSTVRSPPTQPSPEQSRRHGVRDETRTEEIDR